MGRWAQARRRGGGQGGSPPPAPITLLTATDLGSGVLELHFDGPATIVPAGVPDTVALLLDGNPPTVGAVAQGTPDTINISQDVDPSSGTTATWASQPPWILQPVNLTTAVPVT